MSLLLPHLGLIVWTLLAFIIVLFILKKFAWKQIIDGLNTDIQRLEARLMGVK